MAIVGEVEKCIADYGWWSVDDAVAEDGEFGIRD